MARFSAFESTGQHTLEIEHWKGELSGGGLDQLRFTSLNPTLLDSFHFSEHFANCRAVAPRDRKVIRRLHGLAGLVKTDARPDELRDVFNTRVAINLK